jgi:hypothetical protein
MTDQYVVILNDKIARRFNDQDAAIEFLLDYCRAAACYGARVKRAGNRVLVSWLAPDNTEDVIYVAKRITKINH